MKYTAVMVTALAGAGCGLLGSSVTTAVQAKDMPKLMEICCERDDPSNRIAQLRRKEEACPAAFEVAKERQDKAAIKRLGWEASCHQSSDFAQTVRDYIEGNNRASLENATCETLEQGLKKNPSWYMDDKEVNFGKENARRIGLKIVQCKRWDLLFEDEVEVGTMGPSSHGEKILTELEAAGVPVYDEFLAYIAAKGADFISGKTDMAVTGRAGQVEAIVNHLGNWLVRAKRFERCDQIFTAWKDARPALRASALFYFSDEAAPAACKKRGVQMALPLLDSDNVWHRRAACSNLGNLGDKSVVPRLKVLATGDGYWEVHVIDGREVKEYPLRDICQQAVVRLQ